MGCLGYTYVNDDPRGTQCYLKSSVDGWVKKVGVHSGVMPSLPPWSKCEDHTGFRPCANYFYCQPWDWSYYQCIQRPRCYVETNIDYYGNDIKRVSGIGPGECCEECGKTPGCDSYTYINDDPTGTQCYLKSSSAGRTTKIGAISGSVTPGMK
ncbi:PAN domain [Phytophthora infestans]|nr:PAN domain [Phytophthora infestans]